MEKRLRGKVVVMREKLKLLRDLFGGISILLDELEYDIKYHHINPEKTDTISRIKEFERVMKKTGENRMDIRKWLGEE